MSLEEMTRGGGGQEKSSQCWTPGTQDLETEKQASKKTERGQSVRYEES